MHPPCHHIISTSSLPKILLPWKPIHFLTIRFLNIYFQGWTKLHKFILSSFASSHTMNAVYDHHLSSTNLAWYNIIPFLPTTSALCPQHVFIVTYIILFQSLLPLPAPTLEASYENEFTFRSSYRSTPPGRVYSSIPIGLSNIPHSSSTSLSTMVSPLSTFYVSHS